MTPRLKVVDTCRLIWAAYRSLLPFLLATALVVFVPIGFIDALSDRIDTIDTDEISGLAGVALLVGVVVSAITSTLGDEFYAGVVATGVEGLRKGERHSLGEVARTVPYWRLFVADLIFTAIVVVGLLLLVVPGLVLFTWFALVGPVIKIERRGLRASFRRSRELVRGNFRLVLIVIGSLTVASSVLAELVQSGPAWFLGEGLISDWIGAVAVGLMLAPPTALAMVVITYELIDIKGPP
jgi:hypothetical protein